MDAQTRTVMITGAAGNLGRCVAASFHASGANLVLIDQRRESLAKAFGAEDLLHAVRAVVPCMIERGGGKIVNVGAFAAREGRARMGAYGAAKSTVIHLTEAMAAELRDKDINVNCVLPTIIDTPENRASMPDADPSRWAVPQDLANAIFFLASDGARAIHGAALPVTALS